MTIPSPALALWNQRQRIAARTDRLRQLVQAVGRPSDLWPYVWPQIIAFTLEFQPNTILELGRGFGNSTCCFLEACSQLTGCRLVSLCRSEEWFSVTRPRVEALVPPEWFEPGEILVADIPGYDLAPLLTRAGRVLVFWDAHGFTLAEWVLGHLLPRLADRPHVVLMHDLNDLRYESIPREYGNTGLWKGEDAEEPSLFLGHIFSRVSQAISTIDFTTRNRIPLHSAGESLHEELDQDPVKVSELQRLLGSDLFSLFGPWFWFSVNEAQNSLTFPHYSPPPCSGPAPQPTTEKRSACPRGRASAPSRGLLRRALGALSRRVPSVFRPAG